MVKYFKERESVAVILDGDTHTHIFPVGNISAESRLEASVKGNGSAFLRAHIDADRNSDYVMINARRIRNYETQSVPVPARIITLIAELNTDTTTDVRKEELEEILNSYFAS